MSRPCLKSLIVVQLTFALTCGILFAEEVSSEEETPMVKELEKRINQLEEELLEIRSEHEKRANEDELQKLLEEAESLSKQQKKEKAGIIKRFHTGVRQQQGLNPNISVGGDFFAALSSSHNDFITDDSDFSYGSNGFYLRELELALVAPLDPFTRGKAFISVTQDGIGIEEAYLEWLNLPGRLNLKAGIFYAEFGTLNRFHDHALPQFDRPRVLVNTFTNGGYGGAGLSGSFLLPRLLGADASHFDLAVIRGGSDQSFTSEGDLNLTYSGKFLSYYDINRNTYFEWSLSGAVGNNDPEEEYFSYLGNLAFTLKWVPMGRSKYRTVDWKTEILLNHRDQVGDGVDSFGFYTSLQNKLGARFWVSGRVGYSQLPYDDEQEEWDFTGCVDFWQSEFVFVRLQYQYNWRNIRDPEDPSQCLPDDHSVIFHVCWAMGPHKHEAY